MIWILAWRNIFRHKGKTLVIGSILFLGALIMTIGNGIIAGMDQGLQKNIIQSFTGDLVIISKAQQDEAVLASMTGQTIEPINQYRSVKPKLQKMSFIQDLLPAITGYVWVLNEAGQPLDQYILGIHFPDYHRFFGDNIIATEGRLFHSNERGVLVSSVMQKWIYDFCNFWVIPQHTTLNRAALPKEISIKKTPLDVRQNLVFMGLSRKNTSLDVMTDVIGVFKFKALNSILGFYSIADIESVRECLGYFSAQSTQSKLSHSETQLLNLNDSNLDAMFSSTIDQASNQTALSISSDLFKKETAIPTATIHWEDGVFNIIFVKLKPNTNLNTATHELNQFFTAEKRELKAIRWDKAIGFMGQIAVIMKAALALFVLIIFIIAIFIIMNTLILAAMERISEIGMMRAVGARKSVIAQLFIAETAILSGGFGGLGILTGIVIVKILAWLKLTTSNEVLQIFYGGDTFHPILGFGDIVLCLILLSIVTLLALIYPLWVIRKITPLDAIARD